jgi:hypothetical protein
MNGKSEKGAGNQPRRPALTLLNDPRSLKTATTMAMPARERAVLA